MTLTIEQVRQAKKTYGTLERNYDLFTIVDIAEDRRDYPLACLLLHALTFAHEDLVRGWIVNIPATREMLESEYADTLEDVIYEIDEILFEDIEDAA